MKKTISYYSNIVLILSFITNSTVFSQNKEVWKGNLSPKEFKEFNTGKYTTIDGSIRIGKNDSINLELLDNLISIKNSLIITDTDKLINLKGLDNLEELRSIIIKGNKALTSIENLKKIKKLSYLKIVDNPKIINLKGLDSVSGNINKGVLIEGNRYLKNVSSLAKIKKAKYIIIRDCPLLFSVSFPNLEVTDSTIEIFASVSEINFEKLRRINNGHLNIFFTSIKTLDGFPMLEFIGKTLEIKNNTRLTSISMSNLKEVRNLRISSNNSLEKIDGLNNLKKTKYLCIDRNKNLKEIPSLKFEVVNSILIKDNDKLENLSFLSEIKNVNGYLDISENYGLTNLSGLENITKISSLYINHNKSIKSLSKLKNLNNIEKECSITYNPSLAYQDFPLKFIKKEIEQSLNDNNIIKAPNVLLTNLISNQKLNPDLFTGLTRQDLRIIRNLPYAKRGFKFKSDFLKTYFSDRFWFSVDDNQSNSSITLDEIEDFNILLLKKREDYLNQQVASELTKLRNTRTIKIPNNHIGLQSDINTFLANLSTTNLNIIPITLSNNKMYNFDFSVKTQLDTSLGYDSEAIIGITFTEVNKFNITIINYSKKSLDINEFIFHYKLDENQNYVLLDL